MLLVWRFAFLTIGRGKDEGGALPRGGSMLLVRQFAFFALKDQRASYMTCGAGPPCHRMDTPVCIGGDFSQCFEVGAGDSAFKRGVHPSSSSHALLLSQSRRPLASELSAPLCLQGPCFVLL
jgi:hypothetical protein